MIKWGSVEVPELEYRAIIGGPDGIVRPEEPGVVHLPTGMRLNHDYKVFVDRGQWQAFQLFPPRGEDWLVQVFTAGEISGCTQQA